MFAPELLSEIDKLTHADKLRLAHFLLVRVADEQGIALTEHPRTQSPRPVGRAYHSGRDDVSARARELLFTEREIEIRKRHCM